MHNRFAIVIGFVNIILLYSYQKITRWQPCHADICSINLCMLNIKPVLPLWWSSPESCMNGFNSLKIIFAFSFVRTPCKKEKNLMLAFALCPVQIESVFMGLDQCSEEEKLQRLLKLKLRYFSPREVANLMGFPQHLRKSWICPLLELWVFKNSYDHCALSKSTFIDG